MLRRTCVIHKASSPSAYDVVVVGAGAAGCLAAAQLSQANIKTLVVDAGVDIRTKPSWHRSFGCAKYAHRMLKHGYETHHATDTAVSWAGKEEKPVIPAPQVLGGSNVMGGRSWILGDAQDWEGSPWNYRNDIVPRIQRLESAELLRPHRGKNGRFHIGRALTVSPFYKPFSELWSKDCPLTSSFNKPEAKVTPCIGRPEVAVDRNNYRSYSTLDDYLEQCLMLKRPLTVMTDSKVTGLSKGFDAQSAGGIRIQKPDGSEEVIEAGTVVLAAGSIGSARVLLNSGNTFSQVSSSPIGKGFWDVPSVVLQYRTKTPHLSHNVYYDRWVQMASFVGERLFGQTPDFASAYDDMVCFWSSTSSPDTPDIKITIQPFTMSLTGDRPNGVSHGFQLVVQLIRPTSRGAIDPTTVQPNYLSTPEDLAALTKGVQRAKELCAMQPFNTMIDELVSESFQSTGMNGGSLAAGSVVQAESFRVEGFSNVYAVGDAILPKPILGDLRPFHMALTDKFCDRYLNKQDVVAKVNPFDGANSKDDGATVRIIY